MLSAISLNSISFTAVTTIIGRSIDFFLADRKLL